MVHGMHVVMGRLCARTWERHGLLQCGIRFILNNFHEGISKYINLFQCKACRYTEQELERKLFGNFSVITNK